VQAFLIIVCARHSRFANVYMYPSSLRHVSPFLGHLFLYLPLLSCRTTSYFQLCSVWKYFIYFHIVTIQLIACFRKSLSRLIYHSLNTGSMDRKKCSFFITKRLYTKGLSLDIILCLMTFTFLSLPLSGKYEVFQCLKRSERVLQNNSCHVYG